MFYVVLAAIEVSLWSLLRFTKTHPEHPVSRVLWSVHGPRTDVRYMSRAQLGASARILLVWGGLLLSVHLAFLAVVGNALTESLVLASAWGALMFSGLIALTGGVYLAFPAVTRSPSYVPPPVPAESALPPRNAA